MAKRVRIHDVNGVTWQVTRELVSPDREPHISERELEAEIAFHEMGDETAPQLVEVKFLPETEIMVHSHDEDEITYVVDGSMHLGSKVLGPGSSIFIKGGTFYGFSTGQDGLRMLIFRPRGDYTYNFPPNGS